MRFKTAGVLFVSVVFLSSLVFAEDYEEANPSSPLPVSESPLMPLHHPDSFEPERWSNGIHLLAGFGVNSASFNTATSHRTLGLGINFKTDVGWYFADRWAAEVGSAVKFNRTDAYLIWDTLFTVGLRYRFRSLIFGTDSAFARAFAGASPTVLFLAGHHSLQAVGATREQINGPLVGFGAGNFFRTKSGLNWFFEWDVAYQWLRYDDAIADDKDVPIVLKSSEVAGTPTILSSAFNLGLVLF